MLGGERPSQCDHNGIVLESLDSCDLRPFAQDGIGDAGSRGLPIDEQRARAAGALLAAQMSAGQAQALAQQVGEIQARLDVLENRNAIHGELDRAHQAIAWAAGGARAVAGTRPLTGSPAPGSSSLVASS